MDFPQDGRLRRAGNPRAVVIVARDAGKAGLNEAGRHRQKADHIGDHHGCAGSDDDEAWRSEAERLEKCAKAIVEREQRRQQAEREHQSRQCIAGAGKAGEDLTPIGRRPAMGQHARESQHQCDQRCDGGEGERTERILPQRDGTVRDEAAPQALARQKQQRDDKAEQHRQGAGEGRQPAPRAGQRGATRDLRMIRVGIETMASALPLQHDNQRDHDQRECGNLRGARKAAAVEPGREDRDRQRAHAEIFAGADVVERLQRHQREADSKRRASHRQRDAPEDGQRPRAQSLRRFDGVGALGLEHRSRRKIDVRVEHEADDQDGAGQRAHARQPRGRGRWHQHRAEGLMGEAERLEQIDIDIGADIGRDRQRHRHQPDEKAAARKIVRRHQPCRAGANHERNHADAGQQQRGVADGARQYIGEQMRPQIGRRLQRQHGDADHRGRHQRRGKAGG